MSFDTISVIGLGYIGLPTAVMFALRHPNVVGVDLDRSLVEAINQGEMTVTEPDLARLTRMAVAQGFLRATHRPMAADAFLIAVPTPLQGDHQPDLTFVQMAARGLADVLKPGDLVVLESTSPVGTTEQLAEWLALARPDLSFPQQRGEQSDVRIAYCPERVLPGNIMQELARNDRVIGGMTERCAARACELYRIFLEGECMVTDTRTAEMCKLTENSFRDVNLAFANELSLICAEQGIDVWALIRLANRHPRVDILLPGPGVGGHCIAVDPWFIVSQHPRQAQLIHTARLVNDAKPLWVVDRVKIAVADALAQSGKTPKSLCIACFGLTFKPDIDDCRGSPALDITAMIAEWHAGKTLVVEPYLPELPPILRGCAVPADIRQALRDADVLVMLVDHQAFRAVPAEQIAQRWVVDTRGIWR
ncbi:UDP-N-acetyl-D-mannosamine dehydrogenase [Musicola paradisiaca]|uniref:UDP-N-acetyl-D-mannosamine dehydrogenase n=1 Tax=Musicola paradisiaca (strain Ech703) TaxID=579405 RepID=C6C7A5_MUSP7|nr:UDP-N-acetyl-D-mannosamine dehydrogenase [Musicola paradisiaca]ACS84023.1 nucleotide sugar dehydrogenase [Musicola paradisiaca Ech703]